jgi:hypothetical protein
MTPRHMVVVVLDALCDMEQLANPFPNDSAELAIS